MNSIAMYFHSRWKTFHVSVAAILLLSLSPNGFSQDQAKPIDFSIPRITQTPNIDGIVDRQEWSSATSVAIRTETTPGENVETTAPAIAYIMEDGDTLYVAFIAEDPEPSQMRAYYRDRDNTGGNDSVGIVVDTFNDERRAYEFFVNPYGVQMDAINDDINNNYDRSWNAIWDSAGRITENGYEVEMAIPLKQLRFNGNLDLQTWGMDFVRLYPRDRFYRVSNNPVDRDVSCYLCNLPKVQGFADLEPSTNLEIIPGLTAIAVESRDPTLGPGLDSWESVDSDPQGSLDVRWGITQDIYLNATINPDFSQVEADAAQLDVNNTFSLFFPERRTFFLDGADYFQTFTNLVHTRNIASPDYGLKLTGKSGNHSYGILTADDETTSFLIPSSLSSRVASLGAVQSDVSVMRYRYDVAENSTIGAIVTDRRGDGYENTVTGIDGIFRLTDQDVISVQSMHSTSDYPLAIQTGHSQAASLSDSSHAFSYRHNDSKWDWRINYFDYGEDFRADLGFVNRVDYKLLVTTLGHTWLNDDDSFFNRIRIAGDYDRTEDQSGLKLEEEFEVFVNMNGPKQSYFNGLFGLSETYWNGRYFDEQFNQIFAGFSPTRDLNIGGGIRYEDVVDFANTRLGQSTRFSADINYQLGPHFQIGLEQTHQQFEVDGGRLFTANLTDLRATYQFNVRSFLRLTTQYSDTDRDPALYTFRVNQTNKNLTTQLLYSYRLNAASRFFVGYSDASFQDDQFNSLEQTSRSLFVKLSYAWQPF